MKIGIIGKGKVATHLERALATGKDSVEMIDSRTLEGADGSHDLYIISVKDDAIGEVAEKLSDRIGGSECLVAHTSGSVPMQILAPLFRNYGVFYPLQSFTKERELDYNAIPVFLEGSSKETEERLRETASRFTEKIFNADSERRKALHVAAVLACNFVNFLYGEAEGILEDAGYNFSVLMPLIRETLVRAEGLDPRAAQTGPAVRGDFNIVNDHLEFLNDKPGLQKAYRLLSELIYAKAQSNNNL